MVSLSALPAGRKGLLAETLVRYGPFKFHGVQLTGNVPLSTAAAEVQAVGQRYTSNKADSHNISMVNIISIERYYTGQISSSRLTHHLFLDRPPKKMRGYSYGVFYART